MAAPAFGSAGTQFGGVDATPNIDIPAGVAADDIIVVTMFIDDGATVTGLPSGFAHTADSPVAVSATDPSRSHSQAIMWKRATGADSDAGTYDFTISSAVYADGQAIRYTGAVTSGDPWDVTNSAVGAGSGTAWPAVSDTTTVADVLLIASSTNWSGGAWTPPGGFTERRDSGNQVITVVDKAQAVAGATGSISGSCVGNDARTAWLGALKSTAGGTSATATPGAVTGSAVVPAPTITAQTNRTATPSAVTGAAVVPAPTITAQSNATISAGTVAGAASLPTVTIAAQSNVTATPAALTGSATVPAPAVSTGGNATAAADVVSATVVIPTPAITAQSNATAISSAVTGAAAVPAPTVSAQSNATATPGVVSATVVIPTPVVIAILHATIAAAVLARSIVIPTPTVIAAQAGAGVIGNIGDLYPNVLGGLAPPAAYAVAGSVG